MFLRKTAISRLMAMAACLLVSVATGWAESPIIADGERTDHIDGSADMSLWLDLPSLFTAKLGADFALSKDRTSPIQRADGPLTTHAPQAAFAQLPLNGLAQSAGFDEGALEARVESGGDETKIAARISREVASVHGLSLSFGQSASATRSIETEEPEVDDEDEDGMRKAEPLRYAVTSIEANSELKLTLAATGTSLALGTSIAPDALKPDPSLSAEQILFGGLKLTASLGRDDEGKLESSITAGFKHTW